MLLKTNLAVAITTGALMMLSLPSAAAAKAQFTTFVVGDISTTPFAINNDGDVVGVFTQSDGTSGAFLRNGSNGSTIKFGVPGSFQTNASDIDNQGLVTGESIDENGGHCYWRNLRPAFKRCGPAHADNSNGDAISEAGIVGTFRKGNSDQHGFVDDLDGTVVEFDVTGGANTFPSDINDSGVIAGSWLDANSVFHGFIRDPGGSISSIDFPGAEQTVVTSINAAGVFVGTFLSNQRQHCFTLAGTLTLIDPPGAANCTATGINKKGAITGTWTDDLGLAEGYVRNPNGSFKTFVVPKSSDTRPLAINDKGAIVGTTESTRCTPANTCGFLRTP